MMDTYMEWKEEVFEYLDERKPKTGSHLQDIFLYTTDEDQITERVRLIMILIAVAYEVDHNMLTEELRDELRAYYRDLKNGVLEEILLESEKAELKADLEKYYTAVFGS